MWFKGRSISVVRDLSISEQEFLYQQTRALKEAVKANDTAAIDSFRVNNPQAAVYLIFMEDSTRTKESFRNAALFHNAKVNVFDSASSSFKKGETIADTLRMLCGYSISQSVFVMRTKLEGVCTAMREAIGAYCEKAGLPRASFLNGGDGRHEHPTQEFLDEFTFLEHNKWDRSKVHVALVGDLLHGRTVHAKVDGLRIFNDVRVDLIAPPELALPAHYIEKMKAFGYKVRVFESIEVYLGTTADTASIWYFTRFQAERMGDDIISKESSLRRAISFREEFLPLLDIEKVKFFHPLPRNAQFPEIPPFLDNTPLNGWEGQSVNGYYTRIIEIALLMGKFDTQAPMIAPLSPSPPPPFIIDLSEGLAASSGAPRIKDPTRLHIKQLINGVVIDHIGMGSSKNPSSLWKLITNIRSVLELNSMGAQGVFPSSSNPSTFKGLISLPDFPLDYFTRQRLKKLAAIAPGCTLSVIKDQVVIQKFQLEVPPRIYNFKDISCKNTECVSHKNNFQNVVVYFDRSHDLTFVCHYCETEHLYSDIWAIDH